MDLSGPSSVHAFPGEKKSLVTPERRKKVQKMDLPASGAAATDRPYAAPGSGSQHRIV
jgi:hypothetical protein